MRRVIVAIGVLGLMLAACSGSDVTATFSEIGSGLDGGDAASPPDGEYALGDQAVSDEEGRIPESVVAEALTFDLAVTANRKVIRNVTLRLAADDTRSAYEKVADIAEENGGFVSAAEVGESRHGVQPHVVVTVRVPSANLSAALAGFRDAGEEVLSESQGADDVTESFIDLEAQLANLTLLEEELRSLLEDVSAQPDVDPDKLLRVFTEISSTRSRIEQIQGQLNYLNDAVDLATVTMSIEPTPAAVPIVEESWAPTDTARDASRDLVSALQSLVDVVITFVIAVLPMLLIAVGLPAVALFALYRLWRSRRPQFVAGPPTPATGD